MKKQINAINQGKFERIKLFQIKNKAFFFQKVVTLREEKSARKKVCGIKKRGINQCDFESNFQINSAQTRKKLTIRTDKFCNM